MRTPRTRVIGLGSPIMGDDGFGLAVLARLGERWELPEDVELVDGGTWGMTLLPTIEDSDHVLFIDAINTGSAPGTVAVIEREQLPKYFMLKLSPHQIDIREVLAACELRGTLPEVTEAYGAQPDVIDMSTELSPALAARVDEVADLVGERLGRLGHACQRIRWMHEMSVAMEICRMAEERLTPAQVAQLVEVGVEVGDDSGLEPENLRFCLEALLLHPPFVGAKPVIRRTAGDALRLDYLEIDDGRPDD